MRRTREFPDPAPAPVQCAVRFPGKRDDRLTHQTDITDWLALIQAEYHESPGLSLTKPQVQRFWGLDGLTCDALLDTLEATGFLRRTSNNTYVRARA